MEEEGIQVLIWLKTGHNLCKCGEVVFQGAPSLVATPAAPSFAPGNTGLAISTYLIRNASKMLLPGAVEKKPMRASDPVPKQEVADEARTKLKLVRKLSSEKAAIEF